MADELPVRTPEIRLALVGPVGCGKSCLVRRLAYQEWIDDEPSVEEEFEVLMHLSRGENTRLILRDTLAPLDGGGGSVMDFSAETVAFLRAADSIVFVFSYDKGGFFVDDLMALHMGVLSLLPDQARVPMFLIAHKTDIPVADRELSQEAMHDLAQELKLICFHASARTSESVYRTFRKIAVRVLSERKNREPSLRNVIKVGLLYKSGGKRKHKHWDKRWFFLTDNMLSYYAKKSEIPASPRGRIPLGVIVEVCDSTLPAAAKACDHAFDIVTTVRRYTLYGETAAVSEEWRTELEGRVALAPKRPMTIEEMQQARESSEGTSDGPRRGRSDSLPAGIALLRGRVPLLADEVLRRGSHSLAIPVAVDRVEQLGGRNRTQQRRASLASMSSQESLQSLGSAEEIGSPDSVLKRRNSLKRMAVDDSTSSSRSKRHSISSLTSKSARRLSSSDLHPYDDNESHSDFDGSSGNSPSFRPPPSRKTDMVSGAGVGFETIAEAVAVGGPGSRAFPSRASGAGVHGDDAEDSSESDRVDDDDDEPLTIVDADTVTATTQLSGSESL